jgi:hypothetical protein
MTSQKLGWEEENTWRDERLMEACFFDTVRRPAWLAAAWKAPIERCLKSQDRHCLNR